MHTVKIGKHAFADVTERFELLVPFPDRTSAVIAALFPWWAVPAAEWFHIPDPPEVTVFTKPPAVPPGPAADVNSQVRHGYEDIGPASG